MAQRNSVAMLWMGVAFGVAFAFAGAVFAIMGIDTRSIGLALRVTARWSFLLFWMAYAGGAMAVLYPQALAPLARCGREFGLAFAAAHLVHIGLVVWLCWMSNRLVLPGSLFVFFTIGIVWTYLLATLSFGALSGALGSRRWRLVQVLGLNYILLAFGYDFVLPVIRPEHHEFGPSIGYIPFAVMSFAAPLLRFAAATRRSRVARYVG